jgi:hypothetical protein
MTGNGDFIIQRKRFLTWHNANQLSSGTWYFDFDKPTTFPEVGDAVIQLQQFIKRDPGDSECPEVHSNLTGESLMPRRRRVPNLDGERARKAHQFDVKDESHIVTGKATVWEMEGSVRGALIIQQMHNGDLTCYIERDSK